MRSDTGMQQDVNTLMPTVQQHTGAMTQPAPAAVTSYQPPANHSILIMSIVLLLIKIVLVVVVGLIKKSKTDTMDS
jgi:hypothetical protein